ncbi:aa3-type cytochrome oxidase subunit II [Microlunatus sp. Y2014]|uniref:aa3-type cytochrome oxidase subunit II n=1 Tax=Microlunatus sp. Y2014 TaxID=3418488 RepID=UPI003DA731A3
MTDARSATTNERLEAEREDVGLDKITAPGRHGRTARWSRRVGAVVLALTALALAGCTPDQMDQWSRVGLPEAASDRAPAMGNLWVNTWIAAMAIGVLVWGLIIWAIIAYRKRSDAAPRQTRYNLPLEILYTTVPFLIIGVLFYWTIRVQNDVQEMSDNPDVTVDVVGQQWSWTFNYQTEDTELGTDVHDIGTIERVPRLYLPVNQKVRFNVSSPDVIHSFWVPAFYFKRDLLPGQPTSFELTPTKEGVFAGKCAELCGTYHSAMLFEVHVVSEAEYQAHLQDLKDRGQVGSLYGHANQRTVTGPGDGEGEGR